MISLVEWLSSALSSFAIRVTIMSGGLKRKAGLMRADRVRKLMSKESLSKRQAKELERLVKNLPEVTVWR